jgi:two-component system, LytTR family, sensor kinase
LLNLKISKRRAYWILQIAGWSIYGIIYLVFLFIADEASLVKVINILLYALYFFVSTHVLRNIIIQNGWLTVSPIHLLPRVIPATLVFAASNYVFMILVQYLLNTIDYANDFKPFYIIAYIFSAMVFYLLWALIYFIYHYFEKYNSTLKYEAAIYEFELNKLKSQLNPHFIFNALNSIRALVDEDPVKSKKAITQLSNILRNSLIMNKRKLIDFRDEIFTVKDYLELESIRLEERLEVKLDIDPAAEMYQIPPLMLQTLVENGIKHGVATLPQGGKLSLKAWVESPDLHIQIRNSGQYINGAEVNTNGHGIENTRQRLNLLFGRNASFSIRNEDAGTVLTEITIPQNI